MTRLSLLFLVIHMIEMGLIIKQPGQKKRVPKRPFKLATGDPIRA